MKTLLLVAALALLPSCATLLPAHPRSNDRDGEVVTLTLIENEAERIRVEAAMPGLPELAGLAIDRIQQLLEEEAALYEAQFSSKVTESSFWRDDNTPAWIGLRLVRDTDQTSLDGHAFELECRFKPVGKNSNLFTVVPSSLTMKRARAKILDISYWPWAIWTWFSETGSTVELDVRIDVEGAWKDNKSVHHVESLGTVTLPRISYDLDRTAGMDHEYLKRFSSEPFVAPPIGDSAITFQVTVVERDPKNSKQIVERLAKKVGEYKQTVIDKLAKPKPQPEPEPDPDTDEKNIETGGVESKGSEGGSR